MATNSKTVWSWVNEPEQHRPKAARPGRYSRPLAVRDQVLVTSFGQAVRKLRMKRGLSTHDLARIVGMSQPSIIKIETDCTANIELRLMWDFAEALSVKPAHFLRVCQKAILAEEQSRFSNRPTAAKSGKV